MRWFALIAGVSLAVGQGAAGETRDSAANPAPSPEAELIRLQRERNGRLTVPVTIGEAGPYQFLIDTGAQATVLSRELADSLGLVDRRPATLIGMASSVMTETVAIDGLGLGRRRTNVARAPLVEARHIGGADGVLGIDALQGQRVLLDFARQRMSIAAPEDPSRGQGYEIVVRARPRHGQLIITDARIDGIRTTVVIDTGAQASIGNEALARRMRSRARASAPVAELTDINGAVAEGPIHVVGEAKIGQMELGNLPIIFTPSPAFAALELEGRPAMILGIRELRLFQRVAIDFGTKRIMFDIPSSQRETTDALGRFLGS